MSAPMWKEADRISDRLVALWNEEIQERKTKPLQVLVGYLLAFMALERTMPTVRPPTLRKLTEAVAATLSSILAERGV